MSAACAASSPWIPHRCAGATFWVEPSGPPPRVLARSSPPLCRRHRRSVLMPAGYPPLLDVVAPLWSGSSPSLGQACASPFTRAETTRPPVPSGTRRDGQLFSRLSAWPDTSRCSSALSLTTVVAMHRPAGSARARSIGGLRSASCATGEEYRRLAPNALVLLPRLSQSARLARSDRRRSARHPVCCGRGFGGPETGGRSWALGYRATECAIRQAAAVIGLNPC